jgi:MoaA/NifB/PqqE/SkfB family radical SAM enzyme
MNSHRNTVEIPFKDILDKSLRIFFSDALRVTLRNPLQAIYFFKTVRWQRESARLRSHFAEQGIKVPPIMIFSITNRCNLHCKGCYHHALERTGKREMSQEKLRSIFSEAESLGISFCVLAGGEPLIREEILDITREYPKILFLVFTNGILINNDVIQKLKDRQNFIPVISMEGYEDGTDGRRGKGIYTRLQHIIEEMCNKHMFWSVSLMVTRSNFDEVTDKGFIRSLIDMRCKLFFFLEYTPINEGTEDWVLTDYQRNQLMVTRNSLRSEFRALFITVPGDEEEIGGCLSAGKGFIHINAEGDVEPCPFAPYSDANLMETSLKEALQSEFLKMIRESDEHLHETEGGCALWIKREWVRSLHSTHTLG